MTMTKAWFCGQFFTIFVWIVTYVMDHRAPGRSCNEPVIATWQSPSQRKGFLLACLSSSLLAWNRSNYRFVQLLFIYPAVSLKEISACLSILLSVCGDKVCILFQKVLIVLSLIYYPKHICFYLNLPNLWNPHFCLISFVYSVPFIDWAFVTTYICKPVKLAYLFW